MMSSFKFILRKPYLLLASFICLALSQCRDFEDCRSLYSSMVRIEFVPHDKKAKTTSIEFDSVVLDTRSITGKIHQIMGPEVLGAGKFIEVGLNPSADSTTFYLHQKKPKAQVDTVTIFYQRYASLISPKCGIQQEYVIDSLLYTGFVADSILNQTPKTQREEKNQIDVQIFY